MRSAQLGFVLTLLLVVGSARAQEGAAPTAEPPAASAATGSAADAGAPGASAAPAPTSAASATPASRPAPRVSPYEQATPRQTVAGLLRATEEGRLDEAARYLDLRGMRWGERSVGETAELIAEVLRRRVWVDLKTISDDPDGTPQDGADLERIATIDVDGNDVTISLIRVERQGNQIWLVAPTTVTKADQLAEALGSSSWVMTFVPDQMQHDRLAGLWAWQWIGLLIAVVAGFPFGWLIATALLWFLKRFVQRTAVEWDDAIIQRIRNTAHFVFGWSVMYGIAKTLRIPSQLVANTRPWLVIPLVLAIGWLLIQAIRAATDVYLEKVPDDEERHTRGLRTQLVILRKIGSVAVGVVAISIALVQFDVVRSIGWSLLASAGVAGVALGFAAQKSLGAVIAGLQLSVTQPLRLGDGVVVQNQWGEVEEITLTYVRIKLWDERRLVVPVDKFLTEIFENWSKPGDSLIGIVELAVDPTAPLPELRAELERLAAEHPSHDGRDCQLQLIDCNEHRMLVRCRVSTSVISETFAMRCDIREAMMDHLQRLDGGRYLPRRRWEQIDSLADDETDASTETS